MVKPTENLPRRASASEVDAFLRTLAATPKNGTPGRGGRLIFAMDATASREPTWDRARRIQAQMFDATASLGGLDIQLCFYRGLAECKAGPWLSDAGALRKRMAAVYCLGGLTQIRKVLRHTLDESRRRPVNALVFVGDCMEEDPDRLCDLAGQLGLLGVPAFLFQEGLDPAAERIFRQLAKLSGGAYSRFDADSPQQLRDLLGAVAVYAAGGYRALEDLGSRGGQAALRLAHQLERGGKG
jgi:hypothetical protein